MEFAVDLLLKVTLLLVLTGLVSALLAKSSAAARHLVLTLGLAGSLLLPPLTLLMPRWNVPLLPRPRAPEAAVSISGPAKISREAPKRGDISFISSKDNPDGAAAPAPVARVGHVGVDVGAGIAAASRLSLPSTLAVLLAIWGTGAILALARLAAGLRRVQRLAQTAHPASDRCASLAGDLARSLGISRNARILSSEAALVPMTSGVLRPFVLLPREADGWAPARRRVVLLHELAHVARLDSLSLLVVEVSAALYWFHPLVRALAARCRRECENAADDLVLGADVRPSEYAAELLAIVRTLRSHPGRALPTVAMARPAEFEGRVRAILNPGLSRTAPAGWSSRVATAASVALVAALAALSPWAPERADASSRVVLAAPRSLSAKAWFDRAQGLHNDEHWAEAAEAFGKAYDGGYREGTSAYNAACGYARLNDRDRAFEWLGKAAEAGFDVSSYLGHDDDLDNLRDDPRFRELKKAAREKKADFRKNEAASAAAKYERLASRPSADGSAFFQVGRELHNSGRYDLAEKAYRTATARGYRESTSLYNAACAASMRNDRPAALALLKASLEAGFDDPDHMAKDDDLENLHSEPGFRDLQDMADALTLSGLSTFGPFNRAFRFTRRAGARDAAKRYEAWAKKHPESGRAHFNLGFAQLAGDRPEAAAPAFQRAFELGYRKPVTMYNLACSFARLDDKDKAFDWLFKSIDAGFGDRGQIRSDEDLDNLHGDPRFAEALRKASHKDSKNAKDVKDDGHDDNDED